MRTWTETQREISDVVDHQAISYEQMIEGETPETLYDGLQGCYLDEPLRFSVADLARYMDERS